MELMHEGMIIDTMDADLIFRQNVNANSAAWIFKEYKLLKTRNLGFWIEIQSGGSYGEKATILSENEAKEALYFKAGISEYKKYFGDPIYEKDYKKWGSKKPRHFVKR